MENQLSSRDYIIESYFLLLKNKKNENISIQEICNKAGVSRVTFYRNFSDKLEIINAYFMTMIKKFVKDMGVVNSNYRDIAYHTFSVLRQEKDNIKALIDNNLEYLYSNLLNTYMTRNIVNEYNGSEILAQIYSGALYNLSIWWVKQDCKEDINTIINTFFKICNFNN
ncbi:MAG: TetR/AcrR family transcriptional regulator [Acholeplasmatales bacterium]|nr:TetR/AcrR family transcriptional regulator [Acholeplasmatales bacterium]